MKDKTARVYELIACVILGAYSAVMILYARSNPSTIKVTGMDSYTFPVIIYSIMLLVSIILLVKNIMLSLKMKKEFLKMSDGEEAMLSEEERNRFHFQGLDRRVVITIGLIILYAALWNVIGFTLSSVLFIMAEAKVLRRQTSWKACAAVTAGAVFIVHMIFVELFSINLPETFLKGIL
ncbi:tripartite tricarboxylate transporter TctB family protein [Bacilliculturomica massiliensis]|uniref:tripartite tricarboxylate transporter TctB family protein n=1 Tax=Bacilliculturomica massiliensis TaxID=1917867 RepID=UPI0010326823|nr:tripartite tricarboxylate transporter TctB family protein [Bacilliculturomica massiliensis]